MKKYRKTSHSVYNLKFHLVWITKNHKPVLFGDAVVQVRDLIREICNNMDIENIKSHVSKDHVLMFVSVPPYHSVSDVMKRVKGKTSHKLLSENRMLAKKFWGRHLWARGYFALSPGNATDEVIAEYIQLQSRQKRDRDDDFTTDGVESSSDGQV